jgi:hypothetical protein
MAASVSMFNCTLRDNDGPGVSNSGDPALASVSLENCTLSGNQNYGSGGAIINRAALTLTNCTLSGNSAGDGAYNSAERGRRRDL